MEELTVLNFLSNLSDFAQNNIENIIRLTLPIEIDDSLDDIDDDESIDETANLLADLPLDKSTKTSVEVSRSFNQMPFFRNSIVEKSSSKSSIESVSTNQRSPFEISSLHRNHFKMGLTEIGSTQITSHEASSTQVDSRKISIGKIAPTQIQFGQIYSTQVNSTKIDLYKPSFPIGISSEQFFSIHNSSPQIINEFNNSEADIWSNLFQSQTPLNINFQITNLPADQLAEAQITDFDTSGNPIGGTILIDDDANSVDWYIDTDPQDNSEYPYTLADWSDTDGSMHQLLKSARRSYYFKVDNF